LNGKSLGKEKVGEENRFKAIFDINYENGKLEAVAYENGKEIGRSQLLTVSEVANIKVDIEKTELRANGRDLAYINISLGDKDGNINMNEVKKVKIEVEGQGTLQGFGSADPKSLENFYDKERTTYDGKLLAVIRSNHEVGKIKVKLTTEDGIIKNLVIPVI
jgi:beta-galactosidase